MKGIVLAGGRGTRLYPATKALSKQIIPIYDKPMVYYPLSILMMMGIREILLISTERDIPVFKDLLEDGSQFGISISYKVQREPKGIAEALIIGSEFIGDDDVALILGDNVFYGANLESTLINTMNNIEGATIFAYRVNNPSDFGVVDFDENNKVISIEEKPKKPRSNYAIPGLYIYDNKVINIAKNIIPSERGELEITAVNEVYLKNKNLNVVILNRGIVWLDTGTHKNLLKASNSVENIQENEGIYIGCIEEIAFKKKYINKEQLIYLALNTVYDDYQKYLILCAEEE